MYRQFSSITAYLKIFCFHFFRFIHNHVLGSLRFRELVTIISWCKEKLCITLYEINHFRSYLADCQGLLLNPRAMHQRLYLHGFASGIRERDSLADLIVFDNVDCTRTRITYATP